MEKIIYKDGKYVGIEYSGLEKFLKEILEVGIKYIKLDMENNQELMGQRIEDVIFGKESIKGVVHKRVPCDEEKVFNDLFKRFNEIYHSYNNLLDCAVYVRQYPNYASYIKRGITKTKFLRYHVEKYFEEMYILKERIDAFIDVLLKYHKKDAKTLGILNNLKEIALKPLEGIVDTRGKHTHVSRYDDSDLGRLELLEFLSASKDPGMKELKKYKDLFLYREIRNKWHKQINNNNNELKKIVDDLFDAICLIVFDNGKIRLKSRAT